MPIRYEISTSGTVSPAITMVQMASSVISEGADGCQAARGKLFSANNGYAGISVSTTVLPLISIRLQSGYIRSKVLFKSFDVNLTSAGALYVFELWLNPTLTCSSFANVNSFSFCQVDTAATAITTTSAVRIGTFYSGYGNSIGRFTIEDDDIIPFGATIAGVSDILTLTGRFVGALLSNTIVASITWKERR